MGTAVAVVKEKRAVGGLDEDKWAEYRVQVLKQVRGMLRDYPWIPMDVYAEDITHEVLLNAFSARESFRRESSVGTWLYKITRNAVYSFVRGKHTKRFPLYDSIDVAPISISTRFDDQTSASQMYGILEKEVGHQFFLPMTLAHCDGYSHEEIGKMLGATGGAVKSRVRRGRVKSRQILAAGR